MKIMQHKKRISLLGIAIAMSITSSAQAQWPTLDISAIKEGISSKIELVKQSKIVTETTQLAGKMNSAIGDAKASMSKFAGDNLKKIKEQAKKLEEAKKRLEENKAKIDKVKEKAQKAKEQYEKAQKKIAEAKEKVNEVKSKVNEVKSKVDEAKEKVNEVKSKVDEAKATINEAKETINDAKNLAQDKISSVQNKVNDVRSDINQATGNTTSTPNTQDTFVDDYVAAYEAGINSDAKIYDNTQSVTSGETVPQTISAAANATLQSSQNQIVEEATTAVQPTEGTAQPMAEEATAPAQSATVENAPAAQAPAEGTQALTSAATEADAVSATDTTQAATAQKAQSNKSFRRPFRKNKALSGTTSQTTTSESVQSTPVAKSTLTTATPSAQIKPAVSTQATSSANAASTLSTKSLENKSISTDKVLQSAPVKALSTSTSSVQKAISAPTTRANTSKSFRQRAIIKNNLTLDKGASLDIAKTVKIATYKSSETLMFGAESEEYIPDGVINNGEYEETIIPESLVDYCSIGVDKLEDPTLMEECLKKLIRHQSDADSQVAAEGKSKITQIGAENVIATVTESMQMKNIAANYEDQVLNTFDEQAGSASTTRDDSAVLAQTNKEIQTLLNKLITMQAAQLSQTALGQLGGLTAESLGEEADTGDDSWNNG